MSSKAAGLSQDESGIELNSTAEESTIQQEASSENHLENAYQQLERMKQRVLEMKRMIVRTPPTEAGEPNTDRVACDSDNVYLSGVQLETSRGFQQIDAVRNRLKETSEELSILNARIQESMRCTNMLAQKLDDVPKWIEEHKLQAGVCKERHDELDTARCSDFDYSCHMRPFLVKLKNQFGFKMSIRCYKLQYKEISDRLRRSRKMMHQNRRELMRYIGKIEKDLASADTPHELHPLAQLTGILEPDQQTDSAKSSTRLPSWVDRLPRIRRESALSRKLLLTAPSFHS